MCSNAHCVQTLTFKHPLCVAPECVPAPTEPRHRHAYTPISRGVLYFQIPWSASTHMAGKNPNAWISACVWSSGQCKHFPSSNVRCAESLQMTTVCRDRLRGPCVCPQFIPLAHSALPDALLVPMVRGSEGVGGSRLHTPCIVWVWVVDSGMQGCGVGLLGPSWKPRGQMQGQAGSVGRMPAGGFPETGHSSWERFPGPPGPTWPRALSADGRGRRAMPRMSQAPACTSPHKSLVDLCTHTCVHACANSAPNVQMCILIHTHRLALLCCL